MKTPHFWFRPKGGLAYSLLPLSYLYYGLGLLRRLWTRPVRSPVPFILVGNVIAGGVGKTPLVIALTQELQQRGLRVHLLAKGYGGTLKGPVQVDLTQHSARDVGDEPLLLAQKAPTFIAKNRAAGLLLAAQNADVVIGDDGLQNPSLQADYALLVMDGTRGIGNGCLIPAGPLREPLSCAQKRAHQIITIGGEQADAAFIPEEALWLKGQKIIAFAGIGHPEKFFDSCLKAEALLTQKISFPDHHAYTPHDCQFLLAQAEKEEALLVTTEKDFVRLPSFMRDKVKFLSGKIVFNTPLIVTTLYQKLIKSH